MLQLHVQRVIEWYWKIFNIKGIHYSQYSFLFWWKFLDHNFEKKDKIAFNELILWAHKDILLKLKEGLVFWSEGSS